MKIYLGCDHAGFELKNTIIKSLPDFDFQDMGTFSLESTDYPDYADRVCQKVLAENSTEPRGLLICGSGQGMAMRANKYQAIRAALCWNTESAALSREHNDANVLCLGSRFLSNEQALEIIRAFFKTPFAGGRHARRVEKVSSTAKA